MSILRRFRPQKKVWVDDLLNREEGTYQTPMVSASA
jgi:hypothetical protein